LERLKTKQRKSLHEKLARACDEHERRRGAVMLAHLNEVMPVLLPHVEYSGEV